MVVALGIVGAVCFSSFAQEQPKPTEALTLKATVEYALSHYPAVRVAVEKKNAATAAVGLSRTAYLPSANALWQGNRATRNNTFGLLLPQSVVPSISGPVLPTSDNQSVWGSAAGLLVAWEPFDFGYRRAGVDAARASERSASAEIELTRLGIASAAAERFLALAASHQDVLTATADVERHETFARNVHVLVTNDLRPGADASRADAELAIARIALIRAQTAEKVNTSALADLLGIQQADIKIDASDLWQATPKAVASSDVRQHPAALAQNARINLANAQLRIADRSYLPHFNLQSSLSGRGTGANVDGTVARGSSGLDLQRRNWAVGVTATFSVLDIFAQHQREKIAAANTRAEEARYKQTMQDLNAQVEQARAVYEGAVEISKATPIEVDAARQNESQARARYQAGLTNVLDVAEAQSLLVRAESEDSIAKLNAWRAMLGIALAKGDLQPFLATISTPPNGGR